MAASHLDSEDLARTVKSYRKAAGLSREKLAELAGVGKTVVFDIEHGKQTIRLDTLRKVLKTLNLRIELKGPDLGGKDDTP